MTEIREDEYFDLADGLLHCRKCGGSRQVVITNPFDHRPDTVRCICSCQCETVRRHEDAAKRRQRMERIRRRKAQGLHDRYLYEYTFAHDDGQNPVMAKAHAYVDHWPEAFKRNVGLLLFGDVGTGKSFAAGCIANALLDRDVPVLMTNFPAILARLSGTFGEDKSDFLASLGGLRLTYHRRFGSRAQYCLCDGADVFHR